MNGESVGGVSTSWRTGQSSRVQSGWQRSDLPSSAERRRLRADHRDSVRRGVLGWRGGWYGSEGRETSCLLMSV